MSVQFASVSIAAISSGESVPRGSGKRRIALSLGQNIQRDETKWGQFRVELLLALYKVDHQHITVTTAAAMNTLMLPALDREHFELFVVFLTAGRTDEPYKPPNVPAKRAMEPQPTGLGYEKFRRIAFFFQ